LKISF